MKWPEIADSEIVGLNTAGRRVLVSADLTRRFHERARWLAEQKPTIHWSYGDGADCSLLSSSSPFSVTVTETTIRNEWIIGRALIPTVGNSTGSVRLYIRQQEYNSGTLRAGLRVREAPLQGVFVTTPGPWVDLGTTSLGTTEGWTSGTFTVPDRFAFGVFEVEVYITTWNGSASSSAQASVSAWSLCSEGAAWPRATEVLGAHLRRQSGPPDDVWTLRRIRDYQDDAVEVPRVLAHHSFETQAGVSGNQVARYVIPAPLHAGTLTIHVRCRTTGGSAATLYADLDTSDTAGTAVPPTTPTSSGSTAFTSSTMAWRTVTVTPSAGVTNYLWVWVDPAGGDTAEMEAVYATQADPTDNALTTGVPGWQILPLSTRDLEPGTAITNSLSGIYATDALDATETVQNVWTDRFAMLNNAKWWPQTRGSIVLPGDWVKTGSTYTDAIDTSSPAFGVQTRIVPRWAASRVVAAALFSTDGLETEPDEVLRFFGKIDSTTLSGPSEVGAPGVIPPDRFIQLQDGTIAAGTTSTGEVFAGYTDLAGAPAAGTAPARIVSVAMWERPPSIPANLVHIRTYTTGGTIPDGDVVTGLTSSVVITRILRIGYVRVRVLLDHATPAQVKLSLTDGSTTVVLANYGDLAASGVLSFSDAYEDDTAPAGALSAFKGSTSAATWSLRAWDDTADASSPRDVTAWELELW